MNGLHVIPPLALLWAALVAAGWWHHVRREREERRHQAMVERIERGHRTWTGGRT